MTDKGGTFDPNYDTNKASERYVEGVLAGNWVLRSRQNPDYAIDYEMEQRIGPEPTGKTAYIQLKGKLKISSDGTHANVVMETKHLRYYANDITIPVFLVLVDVTAAKGYYLFVQPWLDEHKAEIRDQTELTVKVPLANELENGPAFLAAFLKAREWMNDRHPGKPEASVAAFEKHLESLDPAFSVRVTASSSGRRIAVSPVGPAKVSMNISGIPQNKIPELQAGIEWGKPVHVANVKVTSKGSRLFDEITKGGVGDLHLGANPPTRFTFVLTAKLRGKTTLLILPGKGTLGTKGLSIETDTPTCPIHAEARLPFDQKIEGNKLSVSIKPAAWVGLDLLSAPRLKEVTNFIRAVEKGAVVDIAIDSDSGALRIESAGKNNFAAMKNYGGWFFILAEAAKVARHYGIAPKVLAPDEMTDTILSELEFAYNSTRSKEIRYPSLEILDEKMSDAAVRIDKALNENQEVLAKYASSFPGVIRIFGTEKNVGRVEIESTLCRITPAKVNRPGYLYAFKIEKHPEGEILMRLRIDGVDKPTTGLEPGSYVVESAGTGEASGR